MVLGDHGVPAVHDVGFEVRRGEIVGIAGVAGNGQVELAEGVSGVRGLHSGALDLDGEPLAGRPTAVWLESGSPTSPRTATATASSSASIMENLVLGAQRSVRFRKGPLMDWRPRDGTRKRPSGPTP